MILMLGQSIQLEIWGSDDGGRNKDCYYYYGVLSLSQVTASHLRATVKVIYRCLLLQWAALHIEIAASL